MEDLAWPGALVAVAVFFGVMFRGQIGRLIDRVVEIRSGDKTISTSGASKAAAEQQKEIEPASEIRIKVISALPAPSDVYGPFEHAIEGEIASNSIPPEVQKAWLVRAVAQARVERIHEIVYRLIFGSQLELLLLANTSNPPNTVAAREIFERAKLQHPDIYKEFSFEQWLRFPANMGLVRVSAGTLDENTLALTPIGQDFLHYLVNNGLTGPKYG